MNGALKVDTEADALVCLHPLMVSTRTTLSPEEFHGVVNLAFHDSEAGHYDNVHAAMWRSLPQQFALLVSDILTHPSGRLPERLVVADLGCGTGQSAEALLLSELGPRIEHIDLVDPSPGMLAKAAARSAGWSTSHALHEGGIESLPQSHYDLMLSCSVLHHIPNLSTFLSAVRARQLTGGIFLHIQDPNAAVLHDLEATAREAEFKRLTRSPLVHALKRLSGSRAFWGQLWRLLSGNRWRLRYIDEANARLLTAGVIARPMTAQEFWSVTDIHVGGNPYSDGGGIALTEVSLRLEGYSLLSTRTYAFFGEVYDALPTVLKQKEEDLIQAHAMNGHLLAAAWQRTQ